MITHLPYKKLFTYGIGGAIGALTDLFFLYVFTEYVGMHYLVAQIFSFIISFFVGFLFQKHITFQKRGGNIKKQSGLFLSFQLVGIGLNIAIMRLLVEYGGVYYMYASVIAKGIVFLRNFGMNHRYNFK